MDIAAIVQGSLAGVITGGGLLLFLSKIVFRKLNDVDSHTVQLVENTSRIEEHTRIFSSLNGNLLRLGDGIREVGVDVAYLKGRFEAHEEWEKNWRRESEKK